PTGLKQKSRLLCGNWQEMLPPKDVCWSIWPKWSFLVAPGSPSLAPGASPILPDPLPEGDGGMSFSREAEDEDLVLDPQSGTTGPAFDASVLATTEEQAHFHRNLAAVTAVLAGMGVLWSCEGLWDGYLHPFASGASD